MLRSSHGKKSFVVPMLHRWYAKRHRWGRFNSQIRNQKTQLLLHQIVYIFLCDDILLTGMACLLVSYFAFVAREKDKDLTADDWKCIKWKWVHTLFTGTHNKATDSRDSAHFLDGKTFIGGTSYIGNSFTELYLMKHRFGSSPARAEVEDIFGRWTCWCWPEQHSDVLVKHILAAHDTV